jgi:hypothetical protein
MKPGLDHLLMTMAGSLATTVTEAMPPEHYAAGDAKMLALLNVLLAQEVDRAADILVRENGALRSLFEQAAAQLPAPLAQQARDAANSTDANFRLVTLESGNAALKALLIEVHSVAENEPAPWGRHLTREILTFLKQSADTRMFVLPPV